MKIDKKMGLFFSIYFLEFFSEAFCWSLLITYLTEIGYTTMERSVIFAIGSFLGLLILIVTGYLCDKNGTIKKYVGINICAFAILGYAVYGFQAHNIWIHGITVPLLYCCLKANEGMIDSWTLESGERIRNKYGVIRLFGSIGWAAGTSIIGTLVLKFGYHSVWVCFAIFMLMMFLPMAFLDDAQKTKADHELSIRDVKELLKNRNYLKCVAMLFFAFLALGSHDYVVIDKMNILNATTAQIGYYWSFIAMMELPLFLFGNSIADKIGSNKLFMIGAVCLAIRYVLYAMATSYTQILWAGALQLISFPVFTIVSKTVIDQETPDYLKSSGQQVAMALYSSLSNMIAPLLSGMLESGIGINAAMYAMAVFGAISAVIALQPRYDN